MTDATQVEADGGADGDGVVLGATAWGGMDWDRDPHMRIINHVLSIGMCSVVVVVSVVWLLARRNHEPLKSRSLGLMLIQTSAPAWLLARRNHEPLKSRSLGLMLIQIAAPAMVVLGSVIRAFHNGHPDCDVKVITTILVPPVLLLPGLLAAYRTREKRRLQAALAHLGADVDMAFVKRQKFRASWRMSARIIAIAAICVGVTLGVRVLQRPEWYFTGAPPGSIDCDGATRPADGFVTIVWLVLNFVPYFASLARLRKLRADVFLQTTEMKAAGYFSIAFLIVWILMVAGPLRDVTNRIIHATQLASIWACGIVTISVIVPTAMTHASRFQRVRSAFKKRVRTKVGVSDAYRSDGDSHSSDGGSSMMSSPKRSASGVSPASTPVAGNWTPSTPASPALGASSIAGGESRDERVMRRWAVSKARTRMAAAVEAGRDPARALDLSIVLAIPLMRKLFAEHLELEFSAESLLFWTLSSTDRVAFDAARFGVSIHERRKWLATTFVADGAPMQVNIEHTTRRAIEEAVANEATALATPVEEDLVPDSACRATATEAPAAVQRAFDAGRDEVFRLMETDSWSRFVSSAAFMRGVALLRELPGEVAGKSVRGIQMQTRWATLRGRGVAPAVAAQAAALEFSAESLLFWTLSSTDRVAFDAARFGVSIHERRKWLATTFVADDAPMQVNIGHRSRRAIEKAVANEVAALAAPSVRASADLEEAGATWASAMEAQAAVRRAFDKGRDEVFRLLEA
eukprot:CAMPEP_0203833664 /NCGR_PEP_ID=MMETSP0115-20131106/72773_1 /ASSEMBLY_ACC=CAM_ASM_000227 /TAXON_ID=33651 /ORGANISM="Bicosoecid sp, Strain ms1" /LENGTH=746 /DNA_ID=CAMNT_0050742737 /DNA_START=141 /DNA_END=2378 /DNA_ORIENTATION=+